MSWINTKDELPPEGKYVIIRHNRDTWSDPSDNENVRCVIAKLIIGISKQHRDSLSTDDPRRVIYRFGDEYDNNKLPYGFESFHVDRFFGHEVTHWMLLEPFR